ncbi:hydroxymethylglutaryl-CoA reductase, degradative [Lactobacillus intestinalis]|uniref:3-hydroxy-3-methylglutaryl coenzyme A reductase n=1 Tax=Lactobacillus intestinalis DSM 6629 TaxID=1423761 RepID=A0ABR5PQM7_9LACO|nr:hydroxymethylglutaryl-CoA reductase, degradative [Lactobacillus intestinalis]KRM33707.1 hydroxymethylglutaryl-CoA reductase [Lactobacillus intestinalis DSM 6629]UTW40789.1 hydroxymethylglutaryl-CoA reductase, degradative [Lactobacillus intestinalis]
MKFYQLSAKDRRKILDDEGIELEEIDEEVLEKLNNLSENVIGQLRLPLGVVQSLNVNDANYMVPMATEEPSVIAAANHGASIFNKNGGVVASSDRSGIYGQIVMAIEDDFDLALVEKKKSALIKEANDKFSSLVNHGGGLCKIEFSLKNGDQQKLLYALCLIDPAEAMGANKANSILEFLAQNLLAVRGISEKLYAILSNYPSQLTTAKVELDFASVGGRKVAERVVLLSKIGQIDPYRAVTNNKGIMNGVDAVLLATGNDYRAIEAASAVLASRNGYTSLSRWRIKDQKLVGELTLPMAIGAVGGSINARSDVKQAFNILNPTNRISVKDLANVITSIGLANNLAALLAISTVGIQEGHMKLQARNLVASLNVPESEKEKVLKQLIKDKIYTKEHVQEILKEISEDK